MAFCYTKKLFLFITLNYVHGAVQKLKFERFGSTLQGIRCAIERSDITRFVKFDSATGKCVTLQEDWLIDKRVEKDTNYFIQTMSEPIFEPTKNQFWEIPHTFEINSSVVVYLNTRTFLSTSAIALRLSESIDPEFHYISVGFRYYRNRITINSYKNNIWGEETEVQYNVKKENTDFKVEFIMRESYFELYIDDNNIFNFTHRYPVKRPFFFWCRTNYKSECLRLQYHFPLE